MAATGPGEVNVKNRFVSIMAGDPLRTQAIRVTFVDLPAPFDTLNGSSMWVGEPEEITEASGFRDPTSGFPNFFAATLQCEPAYVDWGALGSVQVYHENIIPDGKYALEAIDLLCDRSVAINYSPALTLNMGGWGDVSGLFVDGQWTEPDETVAITSDIIALIAKFSNRPNALIKARSDLEPSLPDQRINIADITRALDAFRGLPYPFSPVLDPCP